MRKQKEFFAVSAILVLLLVIYQLIFAHELSGPNGNAAYDYGLFLPYLLNGYYWHQINGFFEIPWFTPAFCGGIPFFANPQIGYHSVPQALCLLTDPLISVWITFLLFAALGFIGFYLLLRHRFYLRVESAILGAALFMFNGYFAHRMLIGHLTYHSYMLVPLICYFLLPQGNKNPFKEIFPVAITSFLLSYLFSSGAIHSILPTGFIILAILIIHNILFHSNLKTSLLRSAISGVACLCLTSSKLISSLYYIGHFERSFYKLPGFASFTDVLWALFRVLFMGPPEDKFRNILTNVQLHIDRHELEYGITMIPLVIIVIGMLILWFHQKRIHIRNIKKSRGTFILLSIILTFPLLLNLYTPEWNALLKQAPLIKSSSTMVRLFNIYIPIVLLLTSLVFDRCSLKLNFRRILLTVLVTASLLLHYFSDRTFYQSRPYNTNLLVEAYHKVKSGKPPPSVTHIDHKPDPKGGKDIRSRWGGDAFALGLSQYKCYEPIFGYWLEKFPFGDLKAGPLYKITNGHLNIKNPSCFVFPEVNNCKAGDHFSSSDIAKASLLASYQPFPFSITTGQKVANIINVISLILLLLVFLLSLKRFIDERPR